MLHKPFLLFFLTLSILIGFLQTLAIKYSLYFELAWLDIFMHILGGIWISSIFFTAYIFMKKGVMISPVFLLVASAISVLSVSFFWEILELLFKNTSLYDPLYWTDTLLDFLSAFLGGIIGSGILVWHYKIYPVRNSHSMNKGSIL